MILQSLAAKTALHASRAANASDMRAIKVNRAFEFLRYNMSSEILKVKNLRQVVKDGNEELVILDDMSFSIAQGEAVAIVGASGSGKSTLLGMLAGLDVPSSGQVVFQDNDLTQMSEDQRAALRAEHVGFVFQSFQLLDHLSALENVMLATELTSMPNKKQASIEMLGRVGLSERLKHTPKTLSGGEQQRVALARAFVRSPKVVFADEPTGSLDSATGRRVIDLMFELQKEQGTTLILVTHDESLASRCDRQLTVASGTLVEQAVQ